MTRKSDSPNLDILRAVAVLAVLADHIAATFGIAQRYPFFWALGRWGVLLFFVHTSLVLKMSMERLGVSGWRLHSTFYIRRIFRIYPLSIAIIGIVLAAQIPPTAWPDDIPAGDLGAVISNLLLCQNLTGKPGLIGPLWSLPYEIQMYLILPALFFCSEDQQVLWFGSGLAL
jgi:peptidoglycan/LPS O-acetylase OafA/YrhL